MDNSDNGFKKYNSQNNQRNVNKPLDISSDLWTPISASRDKYLASTQTENPQKKKVPEQDFKKNQRPTSKGKRPQKTQSHFKTNNHQKEAEKKYSHVRNDSVDSDGGFRPISESKSRQGNTSRTTEKPTAAKHSSSKNQPKNKQKPLDWSVDKYKSEIEAGKSRDEISVKNAKAKKKKRKKVAMVTVGALLVLALSFALIFCYTKGAPIAAIVVEGDSAYSKEKIIEASGINVGDNMLTIRQKQISDIVSTKLPYIANVKVDYQLPDTLRLEVSPTSETILIKNGSAYICLDPSFKIVSVKEKKLTEGKIRIDGLATQKVKAGVTFEPSKENASAFKAAIEIIDVINTVGITKANIINVSDLDNIYVTFDSRINIFVGDGSKAENKLKNASKIIEDSFTSSQIGYIDASYEKVAYAFDGKMFPD